LIGTYQSDSSACAVLLNLLLFLIIGLLDREQFSDCDVFGFDPARVTHLPDGGWLQRLKSRASTVNTGRPKLQTCHRLKKETAVKFLIQSIHCEAIRVEAIQGRYRKSWASAFTSILTFVLSRHVVAAKEPIIMLVQNIRCTRFYRSR